MEVSYLYDLQIHKKTVEDLDNREWKKKGSNKHGQINDCGSRRT